MSEIIRTEPAEICGGPLDGTRISIIVGKRAFSVGKTIVNFDGLGAGWVPGIHNPSVFVRTGRRTGSGKIVYVPQEDAASAQMEGKAA